MNNNNNLAGVKSAMDGVMVAVSPVVAGIASVKFPVLSESKIDNKSAEVVRYMLDMQRDLNSNLLYKSKPTLLKYFLAITVEAGELIDSLGYKWWKDGKVDIINAKIEAIDILHFIWSSYNLYEDMKGLDFNTLVEEYARINTVKRTLDLTVDSIDLDYIYECVLDLLTIKEFRNFIDLVNALGMTQDEVFKLYLGKNVLNSFRAKNGYKDNTYIKMWEGREDNHVMYDIINKLELANIEEADFFKRMVYNSLDIYYHTNVLIIYQKQNETKR